jgi:sugar lactone lactonase YvrE
VPHVDWHPPAGLPGEAFVGCGDRGLAWIALVEDAVRVVEVVHPERELTENRFNDGKMGPDGRYWAGTMHEPEERTTGCLYAFRSDGTYAVLERGYLVTNGPAFSPDGAVVYHADSARHEIYAFDLAGDGTLESKRVFARFTGQDQPDGMTTDRQGNLWVAIWNGGRIEQLSPEGTRLGAIPIPTRRPTSCTFVDSDCTEMFVTSASIGASSEDSLAGGLFRVLLD